MGLLMVELEKAKQDFFRKGGKVTKLPPSFHNDELLSAPYFNRDPLFDFSPLDSQTYEVDQPVDTDLEPE